jgi:ELWxxDGT repeat protein
VYNKKLYFSGYDSNKGVELFSYDETNGAQLVKDIYDGSNGSYPSGFTLFDDKLYLHRSLKPIAEAYLQEDQEDLFMCEEGYCGI